MVGALVVFVVWFSIVLILGAVVIGQAPRIAAVRGSGLSRLRGVGLDAAHLLGRPGAALVLYLAGAAGIVIVCWPLGLLAHASEHSIDWPVFRWFAARQLDSWSDVWLKLTNIGKPRITQGATAAAAVFFGIVWQVRGRSGWKPALTLVLGYCLEKYSQIILQDVVHRGHPPTTFGTYPSGGCARVMVVYGTIIVLTVLWLRPHSARAWAAGWSLLAVLLSIQAYARLYNQEHWVTDIIGGCVFGLLLLAVVGTSFRLLDGPNVRATSSAADREVLSTPHRAERSAAPAEPERVQA
jgi:PAP2 superfamily protein